MAVKKMAKGLVVRPTTPLQANSNPKGASDAASTLDNPSLVVPLRLIPLAIFATLLEKDS